MGSGDGLVLVCITPPSQAAVTPANVSPGAVAKGEEYMFVAGCRAQDGKCRDKRA